MRIPRTILPTLAALACFGAQATDYFVVVPVPGKTVSRSALNVSLAGYDLPPALVGQGYSYDLKPLLSVTGDNAYTGAGVTWSVVNSSLPAGLYLTSTGVITGTPAAAGTGSITARATYMGVNGEQTYQLVSRQLMVALASATPPSGYIGTPYQYDLKPLLSVGGDSNFNGSGVTWEVMSGSLPAGLSLTSDGVISGTPTAASNSPVTVRATYKNAQGQQTYQVTTLTVTVSLASAMLPGVVAGANYSYDFKPNLSISDPNYSPSDVFWKVTAGSLPATLTLDSRTGVVSGTGPYVENTGSTFTLQASYRTVSASRSYTLLPKDPFLSGTTLLMHMADFTDATGKNTFTTSGSPSISSSNKMFGTGGLVLNGNSTLQRSHSSNFDFGTGDFTIEFWMKPAVAWSSQGSSAGVLSNKASDSTNGWVIYRDGYYPTKLNVRLGTTLPYCTTASTPTAGTWEHWAVTRQGTTVRWFKNGVIDATCSISASASIADSSATFFVGYAQTWGGYLSGALDEIRITKGVARYTSNFSVQTAEYPNQ